MSQSSSQVQLLNLISRPAFFVRDGVITCANSEARALLLTPGTDIGPYLLCGDEALEEVGQGSLCTALNFAGSLRQTAITAGEEGLLFLLDCREDEENLRVLALAAQQLRGPLDGLLGTAEVLMPAIAPEDPVSVNQVRRMYQSMLQLLRIVGNMSDAQQFFTSQTGQRDPIELGSFYEEIFQKVEALSEPLGVEISFRLPREDMLVYGDAQQLERCVLNLLSNALRFTPKGGFIRGQLHKTHRHVILRIEDSGEGLHEQVKDALFSRYRRSPGIEDSRFGLGLGLLLSRLIATKHGGALFIGPGREGGTEAALSISRKAPQQDTETLRTPLRRLDYTGHWDHTLVELSRELPLEAMDYL